MKLTVEMCTQTRQAPCVRHGLLSILDMERKVRHVGGDWAPCEDRAVGDADTCCDDWAIDHPGALFCPACQLVNEGQSDLTNGAQ